jgi:hypothetical protein
VNRRQFLATLSLGAASGGLAGCQSLGRDGDERATPTLTGVPVPTERPTSTPDELERYVRTVSVTPQQQYHGHPVERESDFVLRWTAENVLEANGGFDVFLFSRPEFEEYLTLLSGESADPEYIDRGSVQVVMESATATVELSAGEYVLVVDNAAFGDGGGETARLTVRARLGIEIRAN